MTTCSIDLCEKPVTARGWCAAHYRRWHKFGDPEASATRKPPARVAGIPKPCLTCGRVLDAGEFPQTGHWDHPNSRARGHILEHVKVMSDMIGRPLEGHENVHHINGDRGDNRPENLELWSHHQPKGQRVADKVAWAKEILALYESEAAS